MSAEPSSAPAAPSGRAGRTRVLSWIVSIVLNVVMPVVTYNQLTGAGWGDFTALVVSGLWPVVDMAVYLIWHRRIDEFAVVTLIFMVLTLVVTAVGPHSTRLLLVKDSFITGLFGVVCLASLAAPRPLMFYTGRKFGTDGTKEGVERWNGLWALPGFRRTIRIITTVWGVSYLAEAVVRVGLSYALSTDAMVTVNSVLAYGVPAAVIFWTIRYSKQARAKGEAASAAAAAAATAA
ncbi:VC0807 family protein [Streptomyces sp. NPDC049577]|uniref:VC0807 family protein n=1 Tax=Streptomyces sp. NPDC049577 TaxID=3155153 RepID=UPI00342B7DB9